jgi:hypothetical protein
MRPPPVVAVSCSSTRLLATDRLPEPKIALALALPLALAQGAPNAPTVHANLWTALLGGEPRLITAQYT